MIYSVGPRSCTYDAVSRLLTLLNPSFSPEDSKGDISGLFVRIQKIHITSVSQSYVGTVLETEN